MMESIKIFFKILGVALFVKEPHKMCFVDGKYYIMPASANPKEFIENYNRRCLDGKTSNT
jgi:hypothetical protein